MLIVSGVRLLEKARLYSLPHTTLHPSVVLGGTLGLRRANISGVARAFPHLVAEHPRLGGFSCSLPGAKHTKYHKDGAPGWFGGVIQAANTIAWIHECRIFW